MRFSKLNDWLDWQSDLHLKSIDLGLERSASAWKRLHPQPFTPFVITVAGTNGKGSSVALLESILLEAGYSTGCYTSPHLIRYNERIRLNGNEVADDDICEAFAAIDNARSETSLSYFEFGTLAALYIFSQKQVDVAILEVGLGGRLDAVNIIDADAALISSIGLDHQDWLGDTREAIGFEKAGILRKNQVAVFSGEDIPGSIVEHARDIGCELLIAKQHYQTQLTEQSWTLKMADIQRHALPLPAMRGEHQLANAAGVVALLLSQRSKIPVSTEAIRSGLLSAQVNGRFQIIQSEKVPVVVDVAHNAQAMQSLAKNLSRFVIKGKLHAIIGMLSDKDIETNLQVLSDSVDYWYPVSTPGERGMQSVILKSIIEEKAGVVPDDLAFENVTEAYQQVLERVDLDDTVLVTGSFLIAGEFLSLLKET